MYMYINIHSTARLQTLDTDCYISETIKGVSVKGSIGYDGVLTCEGKLSNYVI